MKKRVIDMLGLCLVVGVPLLLPLAIAKLPNTTFTQEARMFNATEPKAVITKINDQAHFKISGLIDYKGIPAHTGESFANMAGAELSTDIRQTWHARGMTNVNSGNPMWVLMTDEQGKVYVQQPPIVVAGNEWVAWNLRIGWQVTRIVFVQVDDATQKQFSDKVAREDWSALPKMPTGVTELASIELGHK